MSKNLDVSNHTDKLRRLRVLQILSTVAPSPMSEKLILSYLNADAQLSPTLKKVRDCIAYLSQWQLVRVIYDNDSDWVAAEISDLGIEWLADSSDRGFDIYSPSELPEPTEDNRRGRVSSIAVLPMEVKAWLDQELVRRSFSDYRGIAHLLAERGYQISKSAVGRYGVKFKAERQELRQTIEMAKAFAEVVGDDGAAMNSTLTALAQQEMMAIIRDKKFLQDGIELPKLVQSIAALNRSNITTLKFQIEQKARKQALNDAADAVEEAAITQMGMSQQDADFWRKQVLGVK